MRPQLENEHTKDYLFKQDMQKHLLDIWVQKDQSKIEKLLQHLVEENNPKMSSIMKVEKLLKKHIEFESKNQLFITLKGSMKLPVLNTILTNFIRDNKVLVNNDHSLTWIDTVGNNKLNKEFDNAVSL